MAQRRDRLETAGANVGSGGGKPNSPLELAAERDTTTGKDSAAAGILKGAPSGSTSGQLRDLPASSKLRRQPPQTEQQREEEEAGPLASGQELQGDVGEDIGREPPLQEREPMKAILCEAKCFAAAEPQETSELELGKSSKKKRCK